MRGRLVVHPVWPILIGAMITWSGPSENITVQSYALLAMAGWLGVDSAIWIFNHKWRVQWKIISSSFCISILALAVMWAMYWFLSATLRNQRVDTLNNLSAHVYPDANDVMKTMFSVTNGGKGKIGHHEILCGINLIVLEGGHRYITGLSTGIKASDAVMNPGDSQSDQCLSLFLNMNVAACADVVVTFSYELENQVGIAQSKYLRFVGYGTPFQWVPEPYNQPGTYCKNFLRQPYPPFPQ